MGKASKGTWTEEDEKSETTTLDDALSSLWAFQSIKS